MSWRRLGLVVLAALVVRGGFLAVAHRGLDADPDAYRLIARWVRDEGTLAKRVPGTTDQFVPTAYRPPLYPLVLASLGGASSAPPERVAVLHVVLGVATVALTWLVARRYLAEWAAGVAAALVALDPILLNQSAQIMTETPAAFLAVATVASLDKFLATRRLRWALLAGVVLGLAALCRPTFLPFVPVFGATVWWCGRNRTNEPTLALDTILCGAPVVLLVAALVVAPWVIRNRLVMGRWIATTTHGGYTLLLGNNDDFYRYLRERSAGEVWTPMSDEQLMNDCRATVAESEWPSPATVEAELFDDALAYRCARTTIRREPTLFVRACGDRILQFWNPLPHARSATESGRARAARYAVAVWYLVVYVAAVIGLWRQRCRLVASPWIWALWLVLGFVAAHTAYWSNPRMRGPVMPVIALVAAAGLAREGRRRMCPASFS